MVNFKSIIKKHNKASLGTGEKKKRYKLIKSKHGWISIAMGITIATFGITFGSTTVSADTDVQPTLEPAPKQTSSPSMTSDDQSSNNQIQNDNLVTLPSKQNEINNSDDNQTKLANEDKNNIVAQNNVDEVKNVTQSNSNNGVSDNLNQNQKTLVSEFDENNDSIHQGTWGTAKYTYDENSKTLTFSDGGDLGGQLSYDDYIKGRYNQVKHVVFNSVVKVDNASGLFAWWSSVEDYKNLYNLDTSNCTGLNNMFLDNHSLKSIDLTGLNTDKVTDMSAMLWTDCGMDNLHGSALSYVNLGNINTANVTNMANMFNNDQYLTKIDGLNNLNTRNVTDMSSMFQSLYSMSSLDVSSFDTRNVTNMATMFSGFGCWAAYYNNADPVILGLNKFNTSNVTNMSNMFNGTWASELDVSSFDTRNVTNMADMFNYDVNLKYLNLSSWDTRNLIDMSGMFDSDSSLKEILLGENSVLNFGASLPDVPSNYAGWMKVDASGNIIPGEQALLSQQLTDGKPHPGRWIWGNPVASKASISGKNITIYAGDKINNADFDASATDELGNPEKITIDTSKVNVNVPGTYDVTITAADGQTKTVTVTVLSSKASISGKDLTIYAGDKINDADFDASATDKAGNPEKVTIDTSKVNINVPGTYDVTITAVDGQTKIVKVTVLADKGSINGKGIIIHTGDKINNSNFGAGATDKTGNPEKVTIDTSKVNTNVPGTYNVTITAADGRTKIVTVTVLGKKGSINGNDGKHSLPQTGQKDGNWLLLLGGMMLSIFALFGIKKRRK